MYTLDTKGKTCLPKLKKEVRIITNYRCIFCLFSSQIGKISLCFKAPLRLRHRMNNKSQDYLISARNSWSNSSRSSSHPQMSGTVHPLSQFFFTNSYSAFLQGAVWLCSPIKEKRLTNPDRMMLTLPFFQTMKVNGAQGHKHIVVFSTKESNTWKVDDSQQDVLAFLLDCFTEISHSYIEGHKKRLPCDRVDVCFVENIFTYNMLNDFSCHYITCL